MDCHNQFKGVHMNDSPFVEDLLTFNILVWDIDITDGSIIGALARESVQKNDKTVGLFRCNNHICYVSINIAAFQSFCCPICHTFFSTTLNLERYLTTCSERVKNIYPRNVYQIWETRNSLWQAGIFRYHVHKSTNFFQKLSVIRLWINLCPRRDLQRYRDNNVDRKTGTDFGFHFFKPCGRTNFSLQLCSLPTRFLVYCNTGKSGVAK